MIALKGDNFMLSKNEEQLLKWFTKQDEPLPLEAVERNCKYYDKGDFNSLCKRGYIRTTLGTSTGWSVYSIDSCGNAYLREARRFVVMAVREWIALGIAILALVLSIISLVLQYRI